jgi:hypothetical protein
MARTLINVPRKARRGEVIEIKTLLSHPMETGYRRDNVGNPIPRDIISRFVCIYNGTEVSVPIFFQQSPPIPSYRSLRLPLKAGWSSVGRTITAILKRHLPALRSYECDAWTFVAPHFGCFSSCSTECNRLARRGHGDPGHR